MILLGGSCVRIRFKDYVRGYARLVVAPLDGGASQRGNNHKGTVLRKFAPPAAACALLFFACLVASVNAQQIDFAVGAGTIDSSKSPNASAAFAPPAEKSGLYPSFSADVLFKNKNRLGLNIETTLRAKQAIYNGYQNFRPIFTDVNAIYAWPLNKKIKPELMAGVGIENIIFYNHFGVCNPSFASCTTNLNADHFMAHIGGGVRYYFWRRFFARPEAHLYIIPNNNQFSSNYIGRVGASIGYSFAPR